MTIRDSLPQDTNAIMQLWLSGNIQSHHFIPASYWQANFERVKNQYLPKSKNLVWEKDGKIGAFVSLINDENIGAFFVDETQRNKGVGRSLMFELQKKYSKLNLKVYVQNTKAVRFYHHCGFKILSTQVDQETGKEELLMCWHKGNVSGDCIYHYSK